MDYKKRHLHLNHWPHFNELQELNPWPYAIAGYELHETLSPCKETTFLCFGGLSHDGEYVRTYMAEASRTCTKRMAFEIGDMSKRDFWYSQEWIIRVDFTLFDDSYSRAEYIKPYQFCETFKKILDYEITPCPFDEQLEAFEDTLESYVDRPSDYARMLREYQGFYRLYVARMGHRAA